MVLIYVPRCSPFNLLSNHKLYLATHVLFFYELQEPKIVFKMVARHSLKVGVVILTWLMSLIVVFVVRTNNELADFLRTYRGMNFVKIHGGELNK